MGGGDVVGRQPQAGLSCQEQVATKCSGQVVWKINCTAKGHPDTGCLPFFQVEACEAKRQKFLQSETVKKLVKFIEPDVVAEAVAEMDEKAADVIWNRTPPLLKRTAGP